MIKRKEKGLRIPQTDQALREGKRGVRGKLQPEYFLRPGQWGPEVGRVVSKKDKRKPCLSERQHLIQK